MHKLIHQYWEGEEMPGVLRRLCATWRDLNPGYAYRLWDAASVAAEFAGDHRYSEFAALCHGIAERSDMIRYFLLWRFGGWWADTDFECVVPLDSWDMPDPVDGLVGAADEAGNVRRTAISLLYAEPQCAILERAIAGLDESLRQATGTLARTGNHFLERFLPERMALIAASRVFPTGFGNWREKLALGRDALFGGGVWACHYWWGTWVGGLSSREPELIEAFLNGGTGGTGKGGIFVHGFGGIGNQLFQLAYGLHLEQRFGCPLAGNLGLLAGLDGVPEAATGGTPPDNLPLLRHCDEAEAERILGGNGGRSLGLMGIFQEYGNITEYLKWVQDSDPVTPGDQSDAIVAAHFEYDAFGNLVVDTYSKASLFPFRFSTKPQDSVTGLYYYGYRWYDPLTGRWPSRDPIEEDGGVNLYGFVGNDGIGRREYLGLVAADPKAMIDTVHQGSIEAHKASEVEYLAQIKKENPNVTALGNPPVNGGRPYKPKMPREYGGRVCEKCTKDDNGTLVYSYYLTQKFGPWPHTTFKAEIYLGDSPGCVDDKQVAWWHTHPSSLGRDKVGNGRTVKYRYYWNGDSGFSGADKGLVTNPMQNKDALPVFVTYRHLISEHEWDYYTDMYPPGMTVKKTSMKPEWVDLGDIEP